MFGKKKPAENPPVRRDKVIGLMKTGMDRSEALDRDLDLTDESRWDRLVAADEAAWRDASPAERRAAADALERHGYT
jgi:hypothetical protein